MSSDSRYSPATARAQADAWVQQGFRLQQAEDPGPAGAAFERALALVPEHPGALQLMGQLARRQGQLDLAEQLLRRSLRAESRQPHVWNSLGNLLLASQRADEADTCFETALAQDAGYADAHYNRARAQRALGQLELAQASARQAMRLSAQVTPAQLQLLAQIQDEAGQSVLALETLGRAQALAPDRPALPHNAGVILQRLHRHEEALAAHQRALGLGLDHADAHYNHANTLQSLGRHDEALQAFRQALRQQAQHALALYDLTRLRWRLGHPDFDAELQAAAAAETGGASLSGLLAQLLWRAERFEAAAVVFRRCVQREPAKADWHDGLGRCLVRLGDVGAGLEAHDRALVLDASRTELWVNQASSLLIAGQAAAAQMAAEKALHCDPSNQQAWALLGLAWRLLDDPRETWLNDYAKFVQVIDLQAPSGFVDMAAFNRALAEELSGLHHDRAAPVDQTLRQGTQTMGDIFSQGHPMVDRLKLLIGSAIDEGLRQLADNLAHPFLGRRSTSWRFSDSWSSRLVSGGFHTAHVHPHGWLSAVYYVAVPDVIADTSSKQGCLQLGQSDLPLMPQHLARATERLIVRPQGGRLVLFPSMMWHGTMAFEDQAPRLTIAFDVLPLGQQLALPD